jgi:hypothetical protein
MATRPGRVEKQARIKAFLIERKDERMPLSVLSAPDVPTRLVHTRGDPEWSRILQSAEKGDLAALSAEGFDLVRVEPNSAVLRQLVDPRWIIQVSSREATNAAADLGRIGALEAVCDIVQRALGMGTVAISDLAAAVVDRDGNAEAMEKALRRLNRGEVVTRIVLPAIDWDEIAFVHDTFRKPGARRRRAQRRKRDKARMGDRNEQVDLCPSFDDLCPSVQPHSG